MLRVTSYYLPVHVHIAVVRRPSQAFLMPMLRSELTWAYLWSRNQRFQTPIDQNSFIIDGIGAAQALGNYMHSKHAG